MQIQYAWSYKCSSTEPPCARHPHILSKTSADTVFPTLFPPQLLSHVAISQRTSLSSSPFKTGTVTESPTFCSPSLKSAVKQITDKVQYKPKASKNKVVHDTFHATIPCFQTMISAPTTPSSFWHHMDNQ